MIAGVERKIEKPRVREADRQRGSQPPKKTETERFLTAKGKGKTKGQGQKSKSLLVLPTGVLILKPLKHNLDLASLT